MTARAMMSRLADVLDAHDWAALPDLLHSEFVCTYVHTGEVFDATSWVRLNADYPGFERFTLLDCIAEGDRAAGRAHVTGRDGDTVQHFEVASFLTVAESGIRELTEVWTDVADGHPTRG